MKKDREGLAGKIGFHFIILIGTVLILGDPGYSVLDLISGWVGVVGGCDVIVFGLRMRIVGWH